MATSAPPTPASPGVLKVRAPVPGVPVYGCDHLQLLLTRNTEVTNMTIKFYKMLLRVVFDNTPIIPQTSKAPDEPAITSLTSNYLCLQCPTTALEKDRGLHGSGRGHMFYVDSRSGCLFCQICDDFIWDPTLEELRLRKIGAGTFSSRKRKHEELFTGAIKEDPKYISLNTTEPSCRTSGLRGVYNMGATCFMSVIIQSFVHNPLLRNFYLGDGHRAAVCERENCLSCAMDDLFQEFYSQESTAGYSASNLLSSSWASKSAAFNTLAGYDEQDAHEFFQFLVEELHRTHKSITAETCQEDESTIENHGHNCQCIVHQTFYGKLQSTVTCENCRGMTTSVEPFLDLSLALDVIRKKHSSKTLQKKPPLLTLQDCLDEEYTRPERCEYTCHKCNSPQEAKKQLCIRRLPNVLCIQFKRFEHNKDVGSTSKINNKVQFPLQINMLPYTTRARPVDERENFELSRSCTYDLLSVVVHVGSLDTGHYICYSRVGSQWFLFDDHKVTLATESQVLGAEAFLLFYIIRSLA